MGTKRTRKRVPDTYLTDDPIESKTSDRFDRWSFAERIAHTIGQRKEAGGLVIGVYGEWGDGKTSTLNLMEKALVKYDDIVVKRFNPWYFQSAPDLIKGFFDQLAEAIGKAMPSVGEQTLGAVKKYGGLLATLGSSVTVFGTNIDFKALHESATDMSKAPTLSDLRKRVENLIAKSEKRIVVLIDDIDRLDKEEIQQIFKLVRLSGSFEKVTYVLAFDEKMVAAALKEKYATNKGDSGLKFIEKIVQVPLHLPPAYKEPLLKAIFSEIEKTLDAEKIQLIEKDTSSIGYEFQTSLGYALRTPRQVKRYANAIMFAVPVLKDEVCIRDLLFIEAIRVFYPDLYELIRDNHEAFISGDSTLGTRNKDRASVLKEITKGIESEDQQRSIQHLIGQLFPRAEGQGSYGDDWESIWAQEKRICSRAYFRRYFTYGVPQGDISDVDFAAFIRELNKAVGKKAVSDLVGRFLKKHGAHTFVEKAPLIESTLSTEVAKKIAQGIAAHGSLFTDNGDIFFSDFSRAISFIARTHMRMPNVSDRDAFASDILATIKSLPFAVEAFIFMSREDKKTPEDQQPMSKDTEQELGKSLAERIAKQANKTPPYSLKHGAGRLVWHWNRFGNPGEASAFFGKRLLKKPIEVADFLSCFVGTSYGSDGRHKSDMRGNEYNSAVEIVDADTIAKVIKKSPYAKQLDTEKVHFSRSLSDNQRIVNQFMHVYNERKAASEKIEIPPAESTIAA